jgi:hypothetical protein
MSEYYKPSGIYSFPAFLQSLILTMVFSLLLGAIYAALIWVNPFIYISVLATIGWPIISTIVSGSSIVFGKIRNPAIGGLAGFLGNLPGYYLHWAVWVDLCINRDRFPLFGVDMVEKVLYLDGSGVKLDEVIYLAFNPEALFNTIKEILSVGVWTLKSGDPIHGLPLGIVWAVEFVLIFVIATISYAGKASEPFSENSYKFIPEIVPPKMAAVPEDPNFLERLAAGDIADLFATAPLEETKSSDYLKLSLYYSPEINDSYISVEMLTLNKKKSHDSKTLVDRLKIEVGQAQRLLSHFS